MKVLKSEKHRGLLPVMVLVCLCFLLNGCTERTQGKTDSEELTMYVGLGNTGPAYCERLHQMILENTGINVRFVFHNTLDTTSSVLAMLEHEDPPADIIATAAAAPAEVQKKTLLDMAAYTDLPGLFSSARVRSYAVDGAIYQIGFTSRLIGVEYNKTLMEEMGWEVPETLEEMVELRKKAEEAGICFAVSGGAATGHGFNYLFHLMGSQFLSSADGTQWLNDYLNGETDITEFAEQSKYFEKYAKEGLFGHIHDEDWNAGTEFADTRALFYYNILNDVYNKGQADGSRDEYASMPWLSENGSSSCFTAYDNMYLALDKRLGEEGKKDKLDKAVKVLAFLTTDQAAELFCELYEDGYLSTNGFHIDDTRLYADSAEAVRRGYLQPWYYNLFDSDTIVNVGELVNRYLKEVEINRKAGKPDAATEVTLEDIMAEISVRVDAMRQGEVETIADFEERLDYADAARLLACANALAVQEALDEAGITEEVTAALIPYTESIAALPLYEKVPAVQTRFYEGGFAGSRIRSVIGSAITGCQVFRIDGEELERIINSGYTFDLKEQGKSGVIGEKSEYHFPYAVVFKGTGTKMSKPDKKKTYLVAVPSASLDPAALQFLTESGALLCTGETPVEGSTEEGLRLYFKEHPVIRKTEIGF